MDVDRSFTQGEDVVWTFRWQHEDGTPIDLTGRSFSVQLRPLPSSATVYTLTCSVDDDTVTAVLSAAVSATVPAGYPWWELKQTVGSAVTRPRRGRCAVIAKVAA